MILPPKLTQYSDRWNALPGGNSSADTGTTTSSATANAASAIQPRLRYKRVMPRPPGP